MVSTAVSGVRSASPDDAQSFNETTSDYEEG